MTATVERMDERLSADGQTGGMWAWTVLRILIGWSFLWAFLDKMFGLGFSTCRGVGGEAAELDGEDVPVHELGQVADSDRPTVLRPIEEVPRRQSPI
jgi:hypothetical protein